MKNEYLTIAEFAETVGVSKQAIYQQLNKKLKGFVQVVDGKKCVEKTALALYVINDVEQEVEQGVMTDLPTIDEIYAMVEEFYNEKLCTEMQARIDQLEEDKRQLYIQLERKDKQLEEKERTLQQAQTLHLGTQTGNLLEEDTQAGRKGLFKRIFKK